MDNDEKLIALLKRISVRGGKVGRRLFETEYSAEIQRALELELLLEENENTHSKRSALRPVIASMAFLYLTQLGDQAAKSGTISNIE